MLKTLKTLKTLKIFSSSRSERYAAEPHLIFKPHLLLCLSALMLTLTSGCGGGLNAQETERYNRAEAQLTKLKRERNALEGQVKRDFNESAKLERARQLTGRVSASCRPQLTGQRLGPLPFKNRKGRSAHLKPGNGRAPSGCTPNKLSVR